MPLTPPLFDWLPVFNAQPGATLLLSPDWVIVGASDDYLTATLTERAIIVGRHIFDAFPDNPETPEANAVANVRASLETVLTTKEPHEMAPQHYDVPDSTRPGRFVERHWQPRHTPVLDAQGQVQFIIQSVRDITASQQAEWQLRESQAAEQAARAEAERQRARFYEMLMTLPALVATYHGPDHVYNFVNAAYRRYFATQALPGRSLREVLPEAEAQGVLAMMDRVYQTGESSYQQELELWLDLEGDGQPRQLFLNLLFHPLRDAQGEVDGLLDFSYDVTEQVLARQQVEQLNAELETRVLQRTEMALALQEDLLAAAKRQVREREELYQIFEQAPVVVALLRGPTHFWHYRNPAFQGLFPGRALTGRPYAEAMPEIVAAGLIPELDRVYATGQPYEGTALPVVATPPDGSAPHQRYYDFSYQPYREEGNIVGISVFAYDVTEQVLARQEREAQQRLVETVFEQSPTAIWVVEGPNYVFTLVNPLMEQILGRTQSQLLGRPYFEVLAELVSQGLTELFGRVWEGGETLVVRELPARLTYHQPDEMGYFTFVFQPLRDAQGQVARIACVATDVTDQVMARQRVQDLNEELLTTNEELNESNRQLTRTNVELDTFVYTASHDLKAPITNIEGIVLALRETLPTAVRQDEVVAHLLDLLNQTVGRFQVTIGQLTDISRLQLAHNGPAEPVVLTAVVEDVRLDLAPALAAAGTDLTVTVPPELVVSFSPANLRSIVYNLLSNAVKYRALDRSSWVQLHAEQTPHAIQLTVQDNGLGMSEVQQRQLFGLFQRLHTHVEGTGVGLYITKRLIENAGATIAVQSAPNVGTTFTVTFPR